MLEVSSLATRSLDGRHGGADADRSVGLLQEADATEAERAAAQRHPEARAAARRKGAQDGLLSKCESKIKAIVGRW